LERYSLFRYKSPDETFEYSQYTLCLGT
jgi:hypothetical protein